MPNLGPAADPDPFGPPLILMEEGDYARACPMFLWLLRQTGNITAGRNLSICREKIGDVQGACEAMYEARHLAIRAGDDRVPMLEERMRNLCP